MILTKNNFCPEGAFCVEKPKKLDVCASRFDQKWSNLSRFVTLSDIPIYRDYQDINQIKPDVGLTWTNWVGVGGWEGVAIPIYQDIGDYFNCNCNCIGDYQLQLQLHQRLCQLQFQMHRRLSSAIAIASAIISIAIAIASVIINCNCNCISDYINCNCNCIDDYQLQLQLHQRLYQLKLELRQRLWIEIPIASDYEWFQLLNDSNYWMIPTIEWFRLLNESDYWMIPTIEWFRYCQLQFVMWLCFKAPHTESSLRGHPCPAGVI